MAIAARRPLGARPATATLARIGLPLLVLAVTALSVLVRTRHFGIGYWIDEGLSVGIADRPLFDIPGVMRQDGSPPGYYMLLHVWIRLTGSTSEGSTHLLSLLLAMATIPVAYAFARSLFGGRAGWMAALIVAFAPFLNAYAQETRMYALVVLLATISVGCFTGAFVARGGRRWTAGFGVAHAALLWSHNWGLFLGAGLAAAFAFLLATAPREDRRALLREGLIGAAVIAVLWAPWIPTMLFQAAHTGAPWANPPDFAQLSEAPMRLLGATGQYLLLAGAGIALLTLRGRDQRALIALAVAFVATLAIPWLASQASPVWATRYLAVALAPGILVAALALSRAGTAGLVLVALYAIVCTGFTGPGEKSSVRSVARDVAPSLRPGDLVISTQPEQVPVLHHYLTADGVPGLKWATLWGPVADLGVTDWRDGVDRMDATSPRRDLAPLLDRVAPGRRVLLLQPDFSNRSRWKAPWTALVRQRSAAWEDWMRNDGRFRVLTIEPPSGFPPHPNPVRAMVWEREPIG